MRFFDSLVHVTEDGQWLGDSRYDASLDRLLGDMDRSQVDRACLVAIADLVSNDSVMKVAQEHPRRFVPVGSTNPSASPTEAEVRRDVRGLASDGFAGLKLHPRLHGYDPLDPRCIAAIQEAGNSGLIVFLDTLFRQPQRATRHPTDIVDHLATSCRDTTIVLLHSAGPHLLELFELGRMHDNLRLDLSFTLLRYRGSSVDLDLRFVCEHLDQRVVVGSDFPEYLPSQAKERFLELTFDLDEQKRRNVLFENLNSLVAQYRVPPGR